MNGMYSWILASILIWMAIFINVFLAMLVALVWIAMELSNMNERSKPKSEKKQPEMNGPVLA